MHNSIIVGLDHNGPLVYAIEVGVKLGFLSKPVNTTWVSFILIFNNVRYHPISVSSSSVFLYNLLIESDRNKLL